MDESRKSIDFGWLRVGVGGDGDVVVALPEGDGVVPERPGEIEPAQSARLMFRCLYRAADCDLKALI